MAHVVVSSISSSSDFIHALPTQHLILTEYIPLRNYNGDHETKTEALLVTLNRPTKKNCFNTQLCRELANVFYNVANEIEEYDNVEPVESSGAITVDTDDTSCGRGKKKKKIVAILLRGAGNSFCVGADLTDPPNPIHQSSDLPHHLRYNPVHQMSRIGVPIIGILRGHVITGGFELALACDILLGDSTTIFRDTHVKFGLAPCWGLSQKLRQRIGPGRAKLVSFTAQPVLADRAYAWGLLDELITIVPQSEKAIADSSLMNTTTTTTTNNEQIDSTSIKTMTLMKNNDPVLHRAIELAEAIAANNPLMVRRYKRAIAEGHNVDDHSNGHQGERRIALAHYMEIVGDGMTFESAKEYIVDHRQKDEEKERQRQPKNIVPQSKL